MNEKIIQICPAPSNLVAIFTNDDNVGHCEKVICLALTADGEVRAMVAAPQQDGLEFAGEFVSSFIGLEMEGNYGR